MGNYRGQTIYLWIPGGLSLFLFLYMCVLISRELSGSIAILRGRSIYRWIYKDLSLSLCLYIYIYIHGFPRELWSTNIPIDPQGFLSLYLSLYIYVYVC